jgi:hypothetical protein
VTLTHGWSVAVVDLPLIDVPNLEVRVVVFVTDAHLFPQTLAVAAAVDDKLMRPIAPP